MSGGSYGDQSVRLWSTESGAPIGPPRTLDSYVYSVVFSPDGSKIAAAGNGAKIEIFDVPTEAKPWPPLTGHNDPVVSVCFSPCGTKIVSGGGERKNFGGNSDFSIRIWDAETGAQIGSPLDGHR